jgi:hypothetical protein
LKILKQENVVAFPAETVEAQFVNGFGRLTNLTASSASRTAKSLGMTISLRLLAQADDLMVGHQTAWVVAQRWLRVAQRTVHIADIQADPDYAYAVRPLLKATNSWV